MTVKTSGIIASINNAQARKPQMSPSLLEWQKLSAEEQEAVRESLRSGLLGLEKMSRVLAESDVRISRYTLGKIRDGEL